MLLSIYAIFYGIILTFIFGGTTIFVINNRPKNQKKLKLTDVIMLIILLQYLPILLGVLF